MELLVERTSTAHRIGRSIVRMLELSEVGEVIDSDYVDGTVEGAGRN